MTSKNAGKLVFAALVGFLFLLPHLVRMMTIGSYRQYTAFAAQSPSPMEWDEAFLYGPEANYMLQRHALANDTDTWEHRNEAFPYSVLPMGVEAAIATAVGMTNAQMICQFVFPTITAWLLITMFTRSGAGVALSAALALVTLAASFSLRTVVLGDLALVRHGLHGGVFDTMQGSRNPNPNMSFPLYLGAILFLCSAIRRRSTGRMVVAGVVGGLLFYAYTYYAIGWSAAVLFALLLGLAMKRLEIPRAAVWALATTILTAVPFLYWKHVSVATGAYQNRSGRLGMVFGHQVTMSGLRLTLVWGLVAAAGIGMSLWQRRDDADGSESRRYVQVLMGVLGCALLGGLAGMNMQVVTGFNIQAEDHFPHMILQPVGVMMFLLVAAVLARKMKVSSPVGTVLFGLIYVACCGAQIEGAVNSAALYRIPESDRTLWSWLREHSDTGSVVATTDLRLSTELPLYTRNGMLLANGSRTGASDRELLERYLLASKLTRTPAETVEQQLSQEVGSPNMPLPAATYSYYLFERSPAYFDVSRHRITDQALPGLMQWYREMNVSDELKRLQVDYVWMKGGPPAEVEVGRWEKVLGTGDGELWRLAR